jgi:hypothetical protein
MTQELVRVARATENITTDFCRKSAAQGREYRQENTCQHRATSSSLLIYDYFSEEGKTKFKGMALSLQSICLFLDVSKLHS